jgi:hypothetical protein
LIIVALLLCVAAAAALGYVYRDHEAVKQVFFLSMAFGVPGGLYVFALLLAMRAGGGEWPWETMARQERELREYERELRE